MSISYDIQQQRRGQEDVKVIRVPGKKKQIQKLTPERTATQALKRQLEAVGMQSSQRESISELLIDMPQLPTMNPQVLASSIYILARAGYGDFHPITEQTLPEIVHPQIFETESNNLIERFLIPELPENMKKKIRDPAKRSEIVNKFKVNMLTYIESIYNYMSQ